MEEILLQNDITGYQKSRSSYGCLQSLHKAMVRQSVIDLVKGTDEERVSAYQWIQNLADDHPFSFTSVSYSLGINPEALRDRLLKDPSGVLSNFPVVINTVNWRIGK